MKTILALAAALPLLAQGAEFSQLECIIKDVKHTNAVGMFTDGEWFHKKLIGKTFYVDRKSGLMQGALTNASFTQRVVQDMAHSHQSYFVLSHDNSSEGFTAERFSLTGGASTLHIWTSKNPEYKKDGYPFVYSPDALRDFYSGTCREK